MREAEWVKEFPGAVTVCDSEGRIVAMNDRAAEVFADGGGGALVGRNVLDCHPEQARSRLRDMLESGLANVYTIEKNGRRKLIYQSPWYRGGKYAGLVELALEIPREMPHFNRDQG